MEKKALSQKVVDEQWLAGTYAVHDGWMWIVAGLLILGVRLVLSSGTIVWIGTMGVAVGILILRYLFGLRLSGA